MRLIDISENESGQRLDKLLVKYLNEAPKSFIYKMLRKKNIVLNGKKAVGNEQLLVGDQVTLFLAEDTIAKFSRLAVPVAVSAKPLHIVYENRHVLILNKPAGMLSQKAKEDDISMVERVISYLLDSGELTPLALQSFRPSVVNRLDRNTSGLIVAGKSLAGLQEMSKLFHERTLKKYYLCLVKGRISQKQHMKGYLHKEDGNRVSISKSGEKGYVPIETEYVPLCYSEQYTLLEVHLITGRTHQIRAHLAAAGHPLIGDSKYGDSRENEFFRKKYSLKSQLLHSYRLDLPVCEGVLQEISNREFKADVPPLFKQIIKDVTDGNMEF